MFNIYDEYNVRDVKGIVKGRRLDGLKVVEILVMFGPVETPEVNKMMWIDVSE